MKIGDVVDWTIKTAVRGAFRVALGNRDLGVALPNAGRGADPVILINGFSVHNEALQLVARSLRRDGFTVFIPELPNNAMDEIDGTAQFLAAYVDQVRHETGARKVDLVGYSEGGLIARAYAKWYGGGRVIDSSISLGTPHTGVLFAGLTHAVEGSRLLRAIVPEAAQQMLVGSSFLRRLNCGDMTPGRSVRYTSIYAKDWDGIVTPGRAGFLRGARNIAMESDRWFFTKGPHHLRMVGSDACYEAIRGALLTR